MQTGWRFKENWADSPASTSAGVRPLSGTAFGRPYRVKGYLRFSVANSIETTRESRLRPASARLGVQKNLLAYRSGCRVSIPFGPEFATIE
jgi:hypothetical protein